MWLSFHTRMLDLINKYVPVQTFSSTTKPKWLDQSIQK